MFTGPVRTLEGILGLVMHCLAVCLYESSSSKVIWKWREEILWKYVLLCIKLLSSSF